jgi:hypothetical protein
MLNLGVTFGVPCGVPCGVPWTLSLDVVFFAGTATNVAEGGIVPASGCRQLAYLIGKFGRHRPRGRARASIPLLLLKSITE